MVIPDQREDVNSCELLLPAADCSSGTFDGIGKPVAFGLLRSPEPLQALIAGEVASPYHEWTKREDIRWRDGKGWSISPRTVSPSLSTARFFNDQCPALALAAAIRGNTRLIDGIVLS
jgi:hypothetical protein